MCYLINWLDYGYIWYWTRDDVLFSGSLFYWVYLVLIWYLTSEWNQTLCVSYLLCLLSYNSIPNQWIKADNMCWIFYCVFKGHIWYCIIDLIIHYWLYTLLGWSWTNLVIDQWIKEDTMCLIYCRLYLGINMQWTSE